MTTTSPQSKRKIVIIASVLLILFCVSCMVLASIGRMNRQNKSQSTPVLEPSATTIPTEIPTLEIIPTEAETPTDIPTAESVYTSPLAKIWTGVTVYYGSDDVKTEAFEILGGSDDCSSMPSGKGVYVKYPDGTEEWKDREAIVSSGTFFVKGNDPAISKMEWYVYDACP